MNYSVAAPGRFYDRGEESIVYFDVQTGDTHLISSFAAHILQLLVKQPMDIDALMENLSLVIEDDDRPDLAEVIPNILEELISLDIVEQS